MESQSKDIKIDWTLDVNTSLDTIQHAADLGPASAGLELDPASIRGVQAVTMWIVHRICEGSFGANVYTLTTETDGSAFRIAFNDTSLILLTGLCILPGLQMKTRPASPIRPS